MAVSFWDRVLFDFDDPLNWDIFNNSTDVQMREIGKASSLCGTAQQAVVCTNILRWIPDTIGHNWKSPEAVLFCGSSYAGIFHPFSSRPGARTMSVEKYAAPDTLEMFQRVFLDNIIDPPTARSDPYYGPIERLCS